MRETLVRSERNRERTAKRVAKKKTPAPKSSWFGENLGAWAAYLQDEHADTETNTESVIWSAVESLVPVAGADGCSIVLTDWGVEMLAEEVDGRIVRRTTLRDTMVARGTIGSEAVRTGRPQSVAHIERDTFHHYPESVRKSRFRAVACFPLGGRGAALGVLTFFYKKAREIDRKEREVGVILAQSAALTIDKSLLLSEGRQNRLVTVQALLRSLEAKDSETSHHSLRVTQHVTVMGEHLGLPQDEIETIQFGSSLHDLGKIGIIGPILNKKGKLTEDEFAIVRRHPVIGARIVETVDQLSGAVPIIRHHHEAFDGSGYPDRLKGEEIPFGARLVSVPDFYDALTMNRPYRPAYSHDKAIHMVRERSGTAFDPTMADLFLSIQARRTAASR